jgi:hypothetical protein
VYIIKVKENLSPKYNVPKIDEGITVLGYGISLISLIVMIRLVIRENTGEYGKKGIGRRRTLLKEVEHW